MCTHRTIYVVGDGYHINHGCTKNNSTLDTAWIIPSAVVLSDNLPDKIKWNKRIINKESLKMSS